MELNNDQYQVQGVPLTNIAETFGTPIYVYDANKISQQVERLKKAFAGVDLKLKYAAKSLTNQNILKLIKRTGIGLDVVSVEEAELGLRAGFAAEEILFTPNCVDFAELVRGVELGLVINIDNLHILEDFGKKYGGRVPCCVRINPHIMAGGNLKISVGHIGSKFGISVHQMEQVRQIVKKYGINVEGLHMHSGSDILDSGVFLQAAQVLFDATKGFDGLRFIDLGSGFKVAYKSGDVTTDIDQLGQTISNAFKAFCSKYGKELELWFEPGKFLVSEAGIFLAKVNVVKQSPSALFAGVNSGLNHLLRPMMYDAYHHIVNVSKPNGPKKVYDVVGYICETDTFGHNRELTEVQEDDILAFLNAGAYGFMMSSNYNSRLRPAEVLVIDGQAKLIRKRESLEDLLRNQVEVL